MKKYVVLSVNDNPDYLYFTPITCWAWRYFGWEPIVMYHGKDNQLLDLVSSKEQHTKIFYLKDVEGYRSDTITQISRLYASCYVEGYLMTGDIDMIPLSDYWQPDVNKKTVWGWDLTGKGHYPLCYIGMQSKEWREVMKIDNQISYDFIKRDLDSLPQAKDPDFYKYWFTDQDLITERLKPYNPVHVLRGQYSNGYAIGRVDRGNWTLSHSTFIDAHLFQQVYHKGREQYFEKTMELLTAMWPEEDFTWFRTYTDEFRRLTGHA